MTDIAELLTLERVACRAAANSKKRVLEMLSDLLVKNDQHLTQMEVFSSFLSRERLGSTALGHGVAIPHGRLENIDEPIGAFMQLKNSIDYEALDHEPASLFFALLVPEKSASEHLDILANIAEMFSNETMRARLKEAKSDAELLDILLTWSPEEQANSNAG